MCADDASTMRGWNVQGHAAALRCDGERVWVRAFRDNRVVWLDADEVRACSVRSVHPAVGVVALSDATYLPFLHPHRA